MTARTKKVIHTVLVAFATGALTAAQMAFTTGGLTEAKTLIAAAVGILAGGLSRVAGALLAELETHEP